MITDFDIKTDLKVEFYLPDEASNLFILGVSHVGGTDVLAGVGKFIIGLSDLGGTDILAGDDNFAFAWTPVEAEVNNAEISLGGSIQDSLYFQPEPATLNLRMQSWTYDPSNNSAVRPGTQIRVRLDDGVVNETLFNGFLDTIDVTYYPGKQQPNVISIKAFDLYKRFVNTRIADFDTTGYATITPNDVFDIVAAATAITIDAASETLPGLLPPEQVSNAVASRFVNDATQVGLGLVWFDPETGNLVIKNRPQAETAPAGTWTVGNNHGDPYHLCMSDINVQGAVDVVANSLYLELASDSAVNLTLEDTDSIQLYGYSSSDVSVNTTDLTELTRWGNAVFAQSPTKLVTSVETPAIDRLGNLTEAATLKPGTLIGVVYETANININDYYTITRVVHSIDPDNWYSNFELWKEF